MKLYTITYSAAFAVGKPIHSQYKTEAYSEYDAINHLVSFVSCLGLLRKLNIQTVIAR